jgi:hypothetical protein
MKKRSIQGIENHYNYHMPQIGNNFTPHITIIIVDHEKK